MITSDDVLQAYARLLRRSPESDDVIRSHMAAHASLDTLEDSIRLSDEYLNFSEYVVTRDDLDKFVSDTDRTGRIGSPEVDRFWQKKFYSPQTRISESLDPYGDEYFRAQIGLYEELSQRSLNVVDNEITTFNFDDHLKAPNPYAHVAPAAIGMHMGRIARGLQQADLPLRSSILDMGCGWGATSELLTYAGLRVTAVDINPAFVRLVNERASRFNLTLAAHPGSFEQIPGDELFDAALFYESLHHAVKLWDALASVHARLRSGGRLIVIGEPINHIWRHWGLRLDPISLYCIRKFGWFESGWSPEFLAGCLERCGFRLDYMADEGGTIGWVVIATRL